MEIKTLYSQEIKRQTIKTFRRTIFRSISLFLIKLHLTSIEGPKSKQT